MALPEAVRDTYADVLARDVPEELIDGRVYALASPSRKHQRASGALFTQIFNYLQGKRCEVYAAPFDVRLFEEKGDDPQDVDTVVIPDLSVICDPDKLDDRGCHGAPDMVVEILSPTSQQMDRLTKFNLYLRAGVREYWLVDPDAKGVQVFLLRDGHYEAVAFGLPGDRLKVNCLDDCAIEVGELFDPDSQ